MKRIPLIIFSIVVHYHCTAQRNATTKTVDGFKTQAAENIQSSYDGYKKIALTI